jgi:hypothetical protein
MIKGSQDYYSIQWAERGPAETSPASFDQQRWVDRLGQLLPVLLCKKTPGEEEPYPSCISRLPNDDKPAPATK